METPVSERGDAGAAGRVRSGLRQRNRRPKKITLAKDSQLKTGARVALAPAVPILKAFAQEMSHVGCGRGRNKSNKERRFAGGFRGGSAALVRRAGGAPGGRKGGAHRRPARSLFRSQGLWLRYENHAAGGALAETRSRRLPGTGSRARPLHGRARPALISRWLAAAAAAGLPRRPRPRVRDP